MTRRRTIPAHYISGTHWDREWYRPFQEYRVLLVRLMDQLIELMEQDPAFRYFQLDGQTCMLDDYIQIRPGQRSRLEALIRAGRILVGPWFTMPDLFCVGDEALIRNLLLGRRLARAWGAEPMPVGFICDMFGHPSQMPQIFAGFGYRDVVLGRGTNEHTTPPFFTWKAPDGSAVLAFKLQDSQGYGAFASPRAMLEEPDYLVARMKEVASDWVAAGEDRAARQAVRERHFRTRLASYVDHELSRSGDGPLCLMDAMDHMPPATDIARYLRLIRESCPSVEARHSTLPAFFEEVRRLRRRIPGRQGELREPSRERAGYLWLIPNCVSARVRLKQVNDACQSLLEKWVEPLLAITRVEGHGFPPDFLAEAWRLVLLNHAHDSICGCSIDAVHREMMGRYEQARILGEQLRAQSLERLTEGARELARGPDEFTVVLVNPLPQERREVVEFDIDLPLDYPAEFADGLFTQRLKAFSLEDAEGREVPYQRLAFEPRASERSRLARFCFMNDGEFTRYRVAAEIDLPACGYTSVCVKPSTRPVRSVGTLRTGPVSAENEWLAVDLAPNGTLTLTDRITGERYPGLLLFEVRSEVGDGWFHGASLNDEVILSSASSAQVSVLHEGPEVVAFRLVVTLQVPARYDQQREAPSEARVPLVVTTVATLRRGARTLELQTTMDNVAEDFRLRVLCPSGCRLARRYLAHHPFDFVERSIACDDRTASWQERELAEKPFLNVQSVGAGRRGLAFLSPGGLHEGGVADDRERTIQVTLLRSFRKTVATAGEVDGLERGRLTWRYALMPFAGTLPRQAAMGEVERLAAGVVTRQTGSRSSGYPPLSGGGKSCARFIAVRKGSLILAAVKPAEEGPGLVVRLWNPGARRERATLWFWRRIRSARYVGLNEEPLATRERVAVEGHELSVSADAHGIITVRISLG